MTQNDDVQTEKTALDGYIFSNTSNIFMSCCLYHLIENLGEYLAKFGDFQLGKFSLVGHFIENLRAARTAFLISEKWGDDFAKIVDFQNSILSLVGIFSALRARPSSSHRKKGGQFGENWRFSTKKIEFGCTPIFSRKQMNIILGRARSRR